MTDRILIAGLRELGVHGVLPEEKTRPQPFQVDLELIVDASVAGASDDLDDTVDYGAVCESVAVSSRPRATTSSNASPTRIAEVCRADPRVLGVVVEVRKLHPPVRATVDHVGVRIER